MTRYRILEKKGTYTDVASEVYHSTTRYSVGFYDAFYHRQPHAVESETYRTLYMCSAIFCDSPCSRHPYVVETPMSGNGVYVPKYIVQEICYETVDSTFPDKRLGQFFIDLKEFNNLDEARQYKRELDLEDGIIVE